MCMKFVHQATSNSIFIICYHIQQAEFKTGVGVSMSLVSLPWDAEPCLSLCLLNTLCVLVFLLLLSLILPPKILSD